MASSELNQLNQQFLIFLHIQKTGGITLQRILRRKLGPALPQRILQVLTRSTQPDNLEAVLQAKQMSDRFFVGHSCFGVHRFLPQPYRYITFLREPVSRILSLYTYSQSNPTAYYHKLAVNKSLEEFVLNTPLMELDNGQVRFIAGDPQDLFINRTPIGACPLELLQTAKHNIDQQFALVGLTEYFDSSLLLLKQLLGWKHCLYLRRNSSHPTKSIVSADLKAEIAQRNELDLQLYDYAKHRLLKQLEQHHITEANVKQFQANNRYFNQCFDPPYTMYASLKARLRGDADRPS